MSLKPLSGRASAAFNYLLLVLLIGWVALPAWRVWIALTAVTLLVFRAVYGYRHPRLIPPYDDDTLRSAQEESGRVWLPILSEHRTRLTNYQNLLLDGIAGYLASQHMPPFAPSACSWWSRGREMGIRVQHINGDHELALKSSYRSPGLAFIKVGEIDTDDDHDHDFLYDETFHEVVFHRKDPAQAVAEAIGWVRQLLDSLGVATT